MTVKLLTDHDLPFSQLVPGLDLARSITHAGTTQLGGGYMNGKRSTSTRADPWLPALLLLFVGSGAAALIYEHRSARSLDVTGINRAFFQSNAFVSAVFLIAVCLDRLFR